MWESMNSWEYIFQLSLFGTWLIYLDNDMGLLCESVLEYFTFHHGTDFKQS